MNKFNILDDGLIINKISKSYGNKEVVRDLSLSIKRGEIWSSCQMGNKTMPYTVVGLVKQERIHF